jgi:hypothetical protein
MYEHNVQKLTCKATTPDGSECQARPIANSGYCFFHDPNKSKERKLASQRGGKGRVTVIPRPDLPVTSLRTNEEILTFVETVIAEVRGGMISPKAANAVGCLLNIRLHSLPVQNTPPAPEERSERFKQLLGRVVENSIQKAKLCGTDIPEDWRPLATAMDELDNGDVLSDRE